MINRTDIQNKLDGNLGEDITLSGVLNGLLENVEAVDFSMEVTIDADDEIIEAARNELTEGGFGDDETEEDFDVDTELLEGFFAGNVKQNYQMLANTDILKADGTEYEVFGIYREETEKYYLLFDGKNFNEVENQFYSCGLIVSKEHFLKLLNKDVAIEG